MKLPFLHTLTAHSIKSVLILTTVMNNFAMYTMTRMVLKALKN